MYKGNIESSRSRAQHRIGTQYELRKSAFIYMTNTTAAHRIWFAKLCSFPFVFAFKHLLSSYCMPETVRYLRQKMNKPSRVHS